MKPTFDDFLLYKAKIISSFFSKVNKLKKDSIVQEIKSRLSECASKKAQLSTLNHCMDNIGSFRELAKHPEELATIYEVISGTKDKISLLQISDPYYVNQNDNRANDLIDYYYQSDYIYPEFKAAIDKVNNQSPYSSATQRLNLVRASVQAKEKNRDQLEEEIKTSNTHLQHLKKENEGSTLVVAVIENNRKIETLKKEKETSEQTIKTLKEKVLGFNQQIRALKERRSILKNAAHSTKEKANNHIEKSNSDFSSSKGRADRLVEKTKDAFEKTQKLIDSARDEKSAAVEIIEFEQDKISNYNSEIKRIQTHVDYLKVIGNITDVSEIQASGKLDELAIVKLINKKIQEKISKKAELGKDLFSNPQDREAARKEASEITSQIKSLTKIIQNNITPINAIIESTQETLREKRSENNRLYKGNASFTNKYYSEKEQLAKSPTQKEEMSEIPPILEADRDTAIKRTYLRKSKNRKHSTPIKIRQLRQIAKQYLADHPGGSCLSFFYRHHNQAMAHSLLFNFSPKINLNDEGKIDNLVLTTLSRALNESTTKNSGELLDNLLGFVNVHYPSLYDRFEELKNLDINSNLAALGEKLTEKRLVLKNIQEEINAEKKRQLTIDDVEEKIERAKVRISNQLNEQVDLQQKLEKKWFRNQQEQLELYKTFPYIIKALKEELAELEFEVPTIKEAKNMKCATLDRLQKEKEFIENDIKEIKHEKSIKEMRIDNGLNSKTDILKYTIDEKLTKLTPEGTKSRSLIS